MVNKHKSHSLVWPQKCRHLLLAVGKVRAAIVQCESNHSLALSTGDVVFPTFASSHWDDTPCHVHKQILSLPDTPRPHHIQQVLKTWRFLETVFEGTWMGCLGPKCHFSNVLDFPLTRNKQNPLRNSNLFPLTFISSEKLHTSFYEKYHWKTLCRHSGRGGFRPHVLSRDHPNNGTKCKQLLAWSEAVWICGKVALKHLLCRRKLQKLTRDALQGRNPALERILILSASVVRMWALPVLQKLNAFHTAAQFVIAGNGEHEHKGQFGVTCVFWLKEIVWQSLVLCGHVMSYTHALAFAKNLFFECSTKNK